MSDTASAWVLDVSAATFERDVLENSSRVPVIVDFWAPWCGPCRTIGPILERLVQERQGRILLARVNTEDEPDLASYFQISAIPAIKIFHQGQLIHEFEGVAPEQALRGLFDQLDPKGSQALSGAHDAEQKAPAQAEKQYRDLLGADSDNAEARLGLARVLLAQGKLDEVSDVLEPLGPGGETGAEADRIKAQLYFLRASKDLPDEATLRARVAAEPKNAEAHLNLGLRLAAGAPEEALAPLFAAAELDYKLASGRAREAMVQAFYALGSTHPTANDYRARLTRLLY